jgi:hypothetical protein
MSFKTKELREKPCLEAYELKDDLEKYKGQVLYKQTID